MRLPEIAGPLLRVLELTQQKVMTIILWSSIASFIEVSMLLAFMPLISAVTNQTVPRLLFFIFSTENFIQNYSLFLLFFIFLCVGVRLYAQHGLLAFGFGVSELVSSMQLQAMKNSETG